MLPLYTLASSEFWTAQPRVKEANAKKQIIRLDTIVAKIQLVRNLLFRLPLKRCINRHGMSMTEFKFLFQPIGDFGGLDFGI